MFTPNPNRVRAEVRVMWAGGPSRRWSAQRCSEAPDPHESKIGGYTGSYVCQACTLPAVGVQCVKPRSGGASLWLCASCRDLQKPKKQVGAHV